ncbi:MAG: O-antigen ligase family protein, partial [Acidobacteriota bacterium]
TWSRTLRGALVVAGGAVTAIGLAQLVTPVPGLLPIDADRYGVVQTSTFGYKNPAAWAVVGQIFVAAGLAATARRRRWRWGLWTLVAAQVLYVGGLQSRTALVAFVAGLVVFVALDPGIGRRRRVAGLAVGVGALAVALAASPTARERASTLVDLARPSAYLESDRGIYLRNTLGMVSERPWGVGLGDWQTEYPVYRSVGREFAFDGLHQVRRAHADHVQVLGELGWPGLAAWLGLIAWVAWAGAAAARGGSRTAAAATAQWCAMAVAMAGDYVVEMPYARWQWCLLLALVLMEAAPPRSASRAPSTAPSAPSAAMTGLAAALVTVVAFEALGATFTLRGAALEARVEASYLAASGAEDAASRSVLWGQTAELGAALGGLPFHSKTRYRADLLAAHAASQVGDRASACRHLQRSLALYPYNPPALQLAARVASPQEAPDFLAASARVKGASRRGYGGSYPLLICN